MDNKQYDALKTLGQVMIQIRCIARAAARPGCSRGYDPAVTCQAIYQLADAAHNLADCIADGSLDWLFDRSLEDIARIQEELFGHSQGGYRLL